MSDSQVSVSAALGYAWSLWRSHWRQIWGVLALNGLACTVLCAGVFANDPQIQVAGVLGLLVTQYPTYGSIFRLAFAGDHPGQDHFALAHHGLQWRAIELKMLGAGALILLFSVILTILMVLILIGGLGGLLYAHSIPLSMVMKTGDPFDAAGADGQQLKDFGQTLIGFVLLVVGLRLSLAYAATADSGRVQVFRTWKLTRGNFWRLFLTTLVLELPSALIMWVGSAGANMAVGAKPAPLAPAETFLYSLVCGGWLGAAAMPLAAGVQAYFYRHLKTAD